MKQTKLISALISLSFHILFLSALFYNLQSKNTQPQAIEIQVEDSTSSKQTPILRPIKSVSLSDLKPRYEIESSKTNLNSRENLSNQQTTIQTAADQAREMDLETSEILMPGLKELYAKINSQLDYPIELTMYERVGRVIVDVTLKENGTPIPGSLKVSAVDPVLKVHVLKVLDKAFRLLPLKSENKLKQNLQVKLSFDFVIKGERDTFIMPKAILKNNLFFIRGSIVGALATASQELAGRETYTYMGVNLVEVYDRVKLWLKKREYRNKGFDPLLKYKKDPRY